MAVLKFSAGGGSVTVSAIADGVNDSGADAIAGADRVTDNAMLAGVSVNGSGAANAGATPIKDGPNGLNSGLVNSANGGEPNTVIFW